MLLNGMLYNSEVWHSLSEKEIRMLEMVDEYLLRSMVKGHSKTPLEFLYLEAGALPIRFIISSRRLNYLHTLLKRPEHEITRQVYEAQKNNTVRGDFYELVQSDIDAVGGGLTEEIIEQSSKADFKSKVKAKITQAALEYLKAKQQGHSKVKSIKYQKLQTQHYIKSPLFNNNEVNLLHALRSRMVNTKANFPSKYQNNLNCPLCDRSRDDQPHILECQVLKDKLKTEEVTIERNVYNDLFEDTLKQKEITVLFSRLLDIRETLVDEDLVKMTNPSSSAEMLKSNDDLQRCIVQCSFGK